MLEITPVTLGEVMYRFNHSLKDRYPDLKWNNRLAIFGRSVCLSIILTKLICSWEKELSLLYDPLA
jgi:hypothetical protein